MVILSKLARKIKWNTSLITTNPTKTFMVTHAFQNIIFYNKTVEV